MHNTFVQVRMKHRCYICGIGIGISYFFIGDKWEKFEHTYRESFNINIKGIDRILDEDCYKRIKRKKRPVYYVLRNHLIYEKGKNNYGKIPKSKRSFF